MTKRARVESVKSSRFDSLCKVLSLLSSSALSSTSAYGLFLSLGALLSMALAYFKALLCS